MGGAMHALVLPLLLAGAPGQDLSIPPLTGPVVDRAGLLGQRDAALIAGGLRDYRQRTGNQLQVLIIPSLPEGMPVEDYSIRVVEQWKLGSAEKDNGVLLLVSVQDRKWRIEVGGGLEGDLTDVAASRIGRGILVPALQRGDYASGIAGTLQAIAQQLGGDLSFQGLPMARRSRRGNPLGALPVLIFVILMMILGRRRGFGFLGWMLLGSAMGRGSRGSWGGGGGGGGGSWGGGGGGFSGGGAGGGW